MSEFNWLLKGVPETGLAESVEIGFPVPYKDLAPAGVEFMWKVIQFTFALPSLELPSLPLTALAPDARSQLDRLVRSVKSLASSPFMATDSSLTLRSTPSSTEYVGVFPHPESLRGFLALFRQVNDQREPASYQKTHDIIRCSLAQHEDEGAIARLDAWGRAHKKLNHRPAQTWMRLKMRRLEASSKSPEARTTINTPSYPLNVLLDLFMYGEHIHYDRHRSQLLDSFTEEQTAVLKFELQKGVKGLTCFYMGIAESIERSTA